MDGSETMMYNDGRHYEGQMKDGFPHGTGELTYSDGRVHRGEFADGVPHGAGKVTHPNGDVLSGTWRAGKWHGSIKMTTGDYVSEVEYVDGVAADTGTAKYNDGASYSGEVRHLRPHGKGVLTAADGSWVYRGEFANGKRWGGGVQLPASFPSAVSSTAGSSSSIPPSGATRCVYAGPWEDDKKHGRGIEGSGVVGEIAVAVLYEQGTLVSMTHIAEAWVPQGEWHLAYLLYVDATVPDSSAPVDGVVAEYLETVRRDVLEPTLAALTSRASELAASGTSNDSDRSVTVRRALARAVELASEQGAILTYVEAVRWATAVHEQTQAVGRKRGTYRMPDGALYDGKLEDGIPHGTGEFEFPDGREHRGEFADGMPHGAGQLTYPDGAKLSGTWRAGKWHGSMKMTTGNYVSEIEYADGVAAADTWTAKYNDGTSYDGDFRHLRPHGKGVLTSADGSWVYRGEFADGKRWGDGVQLPASFPSAVSSTAGSSSSTPPSEAARCVYAGPWEDDKKHGRGIEGSGVVGEFAVAVLYEKGKLVSETPIAEAWALDVEWHLAHRLYVDATVPDSSAPVDGMMTEYLETVRRDVLEPTLAALTLRASELAATDPFQLSERSLTVRRALARAVELASEITAVETYVEAVRWATAVHEQTQAVGRKTGTYRMPDGALYDGELEDGIPHGTGVLTFADGRMYRGEFADGDRHGPGQVTYPDGIVLSGTWRAGKPHGRMKRTTHLMGYEAEYVDGLCVEGAVTHDGGERVSAAWLDNDNSANPLRFKMLVDLLWMLQVE